MKFTRSNGMQYSYLRHGAKAKIWGTQQGHIMVESGKFTNKHGVAILLNRRWHNRINWIQFACERVVAMSIGQRATGSADDCVYASQ